MFILRKLQSLHGGKKNLSLVSIILFSPFFFFLRPSLAPNLSPNLSPPYRFNLVSCLEPITLSGAKTLDALKADNQDLTQSPDTFAKGLAQDLAGRDNEDDLAPLKPQERRG